MTLRCPACDQADELLPQRLEADLPAAACPGCGGVLLGLVSWRHWHQRHGRTIPAQADAPGDAAHADDSRSALRCPKCSAFMTKYRFAADSENQIDHCSHCDEVWLDRGEWELLERFAVTAELGQVFTRPFQSRVRSDEARLRQEARYRELFGDDYDYVKQVREWLTAHPKSREILAYLYLSQTS